jgi:hypothetical protein
MKNLKYVLAIVLGLMFTSCEDFIIEPHEDDPVGIPPPPPKPRP